MKAFQVGGLLLLSVGMTWLFGPSLLKGYESAQWPLVEAEVLASVKGQPRANRASLYVDVRYEYSYGGRVHGGDNVDFRYLKLRYAEPPPKGAKVMVAVNPANARESVLRPGFSIADLALVAISWLATLLMIADSVWRGKARSPSLPARPSTRS